MQPAQGTWPHKRCPEDVGGNCQLPLAVYPYSSCRPAVAVREEVHEVMQGTGYPGPPGMTATNTAAAAAARGAADAGLLTAEQLARLAEADTKAARRADKKVGVLRHCCLRALCENAAPGCSGADETSLVLAGRLAGPDKLSITVICDISVYDRPLVSQVQQGCLSGMLCTWPKEY